MKRVQCLVLHFVLIAGALPALLEDDGHTHRNGSPTRAAQ